MCGITGLIDFRYKSSPESLQKMTQTLRHRGPDGEGVYWKHMPLYQIGLGHTRLSLLDQTSLASQPYRWKHWVLVFNGEIYNYKEIRAELQDKGYYFEGESDTEVLIKAIDYWGDSAIERFNGMFAFGLFHQESQRLIFARDRAGSKPLYLYHSKNLILFGSELKALLAHDDFPKIIDSQSLGLFFQYGYISSPNCIFENTRKIHAGQLLTIDLHQNEARNETYWSISNFCSKTSLSSNLTEIHLLDELDKHLEKACLSRMIADHPIGLYLSGGYDSSLVAYYAHKHPNFHKAYCLGFDESEYNEIPYAQKIAQHLSIPFESYILNNTEALSNTQKLSEVFDEPFGDSSALACLVLSNFVRPSVKAIVSAEGGDELWAGYPRYLKSMQFYRFLQYVPKSLLRYGLAPWGGDRKIAKFRQILQHAEHPSWILDSFNQALSGDMVHQLVNGSHPGVGFDRRDASAPKYPLQTMLNWDYDHYLVDDLMVKADRTGMAVGLEIREPFLHQNFVEWTACLPPQFKIRGHTQKYLLKELAHQKFPKSLLNRPKKGFGIPLGKWLRSSLKELVLDTLSHPVIDRHRLLNTKMVDLYLKRFYSGSDHYASNIWHLLQFQLWYNRWL